MVSSTSPSGSTSERTSPVAATRPVRYGVYDIAANQGWVNVGVDHDTAQFAVNSIRSWWQHLGRQRYPDATGCRSPPTAAAQTATASACGRSAATSRRRDRTGDLGLPPPARHQQVDKIEHRLFS